MQYNKMKMFLVDILVFFVSYCLFIHGYQEIRVLFQLSAINIAVLFATFFLVNLLKSFRLYLELYGEDISREEYLAFFTKTAIVITIIPWKLGDFYRFYCLGRIINNPIKGIVIIFFDRFIDTLGLLSVLGILIVALGVSGSYVFYLMFLFCIILIVLYHIFLGIYSFWSHYFIVVPGSQHRLKILKTLYSLFCLYKDIQAVINGKGIVLYILSVLAWCIELLSAYWLCTLSNSWCYDLAQQYISSLLGYYNIPVLNQYAYFSVIVFTIVSICITVYKNKEHSLK